MLFLLDTNAITGLMKGDPALTVWLESLQPEDHIVTCTIVRGEILFGIRRLPAGRRQTELQAKVLQVFESIPCVPIPAAAADTYAAVKISQQVRCLSLDENDL